MALDRNSLIDLITDRVMARLTVSPSALKTPDESDLRAMVANGACRLACEVKARSFPADLAGTIDHTLLKPDATEDQVRKLAEEAREFGFASVCINPYWVPLCAEMLRGSPVEVCTVIGFPLGATTSETKAFETSQAVARGATEVDMVLNIGALKARNYTAVHDDIAAVVAATSGHACVKVILETALLDDDEKTAASALAKEAGAHYVKTSTGFGGGGATVHDVALMRTVVGTDVGVKASGGIGDRETAEQLLLAGANRLGASAGVKIVAGERGSQAY